MNIEEIMLKNADLEKLEELGFIQNGKVTSTYIGIYQLYASLLMEYLDKKLKLREKEEKIKNSPLQIQPLKEDKDIYQSLSPFEFFFLRNTLRIERLSKDSL